MYIFAFVEKLECVFIGYFLVLVSNKKRHQQDIIKDVWFNFISIFIELKCHQQSTKCVICQGF